MQSFHNDIEVKNKYVNRVKLHAEADEIVQGTTWEDGKGCAIGCTLDGYDHSAYPTELGLPEWLAKLEDRLFEGMENKHAMKFPVKFLESIPVGVDIEPVEWKFCSYLCAENIKRVNKLDIDKDLKNQVIDAIKGSKKLHDNAIKSGSWDESAAWSAAESAASAAESARSAAWSAAWSAAESAASAAESARSAAESATRSATLAAAWSAESAAWSSESAAWSSESAAWSSVYKKYSDHLLNLLREA